jgi:L-2,4-diaminobutyric acid acetyltransferase
MTARLRHPTPEDAPAVWRLVQQSGVLDLNSPYAYVALFAHFPTTCAVAEREGQLVGFVTGYRVPARPQVHFVWQVGVRADQRGSGLGTAMLLWLLGEGAPTPVQSLEATVTPSNQASRRLFFGLARVLQTDCVVRPGFPPELLGEGHEPEELFCIGPIDRSLS